MHSTAATEIIADAHTSFARHLANADFDALGSLFCEHARLLAPNFPALVGRDNIREFWRQAKAIDSMRFDARSIKPLGTVAIREIGDLHIALHAVRAGGSGSVSSKYLLVWQKIGEEWKIESGMWNRGTPVHRPPTGARAGASAPDRDVAPERAPFVPIVG